MTYDDGRTTAPAYTISSLNEPKGSGELKMIQGYGIFWSFIMGYGILSTPLNKPLLKILSCFIRFISSM